MSLDERCNLALAIAQALYVNGQSTEQTVAGGERLGKILGLRARIMARWGELQLQADDGDAHLSCAVAANPAGVNMARVISAMRVIDDVRKGQLAPAGASEAISAISHVPPAPTWLFTLAVAAGAVALAVIFGVQHLPASALILMSAAAGAVLRRCLARYSDNLLLQPFCAALLAGVIGALATRYQLSSSLRLVAVCPCMILVPGPHVLNGALDLIRGRVHLGAARLLYAGLVVLAISIGLLLGLALLGISLGRRHRRGHSGRRLQRLLLHASVHVALAGGGRHAGACSEVVDTFTGGWCRDRRVGCLSGRRAGPHAGRSSFSRAVRGHRICFRRVDDSGCLPVQNGEWACATCHQFKYDLAALRGNDRRRPHRYQHHYRYELWPHCSKAHHRSSLRWRSAVSVLSREKNVWIHGIENSK